MQNSQYWVIFFIVIQTSLIIFLKRNYWKKIILLFIYSIATALAGWNFLQDHLALKDAFYIGHIIPESATETLSDTFLTYYLFVLFNLIYVGYLNFKKDSYLNRTIKFSSSPSEK